MAKVIHAAISDIKRRTIFLECGLFSGLIRYFGKIEYDNIEKFHPNKDNVVAYWVDCVPLAELLEQNSISMVDILMIDTEGAELTILQSITQELINIKVVMTESNDRSSRIEVLDFMRNNNFTFIIGLGMDDVYINNLFISEFNVHPTNF